MFIGIDLDEVLASTINPLLAYHNERYGTALVKKQVHSHNLWEVWGGTREQAEEKVREFYNSPYFWKIQPVKGSQQAVEILSKNHELIIISSRPKNMSEKGIEWVEKYFPNRFSEFYFTEQCFSPNAKKKSDLCLELKIDSLIEDNLEYARNCALTRTKVLLLDKPWNKSDDLPERVTRVYSWQEILENVK